MLSQIWENIQCLLFWNWLNSLSLIISNWFHFTVKEKIFILFYFMTEYFVVYEYHIFFIILLVDRHLGLFLTLGIVNCAAINMGTHKNLLKSDFISFRELFLGVECLSHMVDLFSRIRGVSLLSSNCRILSMFSKGEFLQSPYIYLAGAVVEWIKRLLESSIAFGCWFMHQLLRFESRPLLLV